MTDLITRRLPADLAARLPRGTGLPSATDRAWWQRLAAARPATAAWLRSEADAVQASRIPDLPLAGVAAFWPTGDRSGHEQPYFARRRRLACLTLAEAIDGDGQRLDAIAEHLWAIVAEPLWVLPAHAGYRRGAMDTSAWIDPVPEPGWEGVDLFAAETAQVLAECVEVLRAPLQARSASLLAWVRQAVTTRVIDPIVHAEPWDWSTPETKWRRWPWWIFTPRNNWTPWCSFGAISAALILDDDRDRAAALVRRLCGALDGYLAVQPADGACDEGLSYWNAAVGELLQTLELLTPVLGEDVFREPLLRALASYPAAVHVGGERFATVADARPLARPRRELLWRFGARCDLPALSALTQVLAAPGAAPGTEHTGAQLMQWRRALCWLPANESAAIAAPTDRDDWLPGVQLLVRRCAGVALVAKGGHNDENHNHNDLGHVALAVDGQPRLLDVGIGTYDRSSFGGERWSSWLVRGAGHNAAVVNGTEQAPGRAYAATAERLADGLRLDLSVAYPVAAGIASYQRSARLSADGVASISDTLAVTTPEWSAAITLYTPDTVTPDASGVLRLHGAGRELQMSVDGDLQVIACEPVPLDDPLLVAGYGPQLTRIRLAGHGPGNAAWWTITVTPHRAP